MGETARIATKITMDRQDFSHLFHTTQEWARYANGSDGGWSQQVRDGRFRLVDGSEAWPDLKWKWSYWTDGYANVILARSFLAARGAQYQVVSDEAGGWGILTDYECLP